MQGFENAKGRQRASTRMSDYADMLEWPERDYGRIRLIGPVFSVCNYWFRIRTKKNPESGSSIPKRCLDHDGNTDEMVTDICPYRASGAGRESREYYVNAIVRDEQEGRDFRPIRGRKEEHCGYEAHWVRKGDTRITPVRLLQIPDSQIEKLQGFKKLNRVKDRHGNVRAVDIMHPRYGCDIQIQYFPDKQGPAKYDIQKDERTPLTEEELDYGLYRPDLLPVETIEAAKREIADLKSKLVEDKKKDDKRSREDDGDIDPADRRGGRRSRRDEVDDPLMEDDTVHLDEDDLDDAPRGKRRRDEYADLDADLDDADDRRSSRRDREERRSSRRDREDREERRARRRDEDDDRRSSRDEDDDVDDRRERRRSRRDRDDEGYDD